MKYTEPNNDEQITFVHRVGGTEVLVTVTAAYFSAELSGHDGEWDITEVTIAGNDTNLIEIFSHAQQHDMQEAAAAIYMNKKYTQSPPVNTPSNPPKGLYPPSSYTPD